MQTRAKVKQRDFQIKLYNYVPKRTDAFLKPKDGDS